MSQIRQITGRAVAVHGADIDTDRIIPARFLKTITFEGLDEHVFEDDRLEAKTQGRIHPFDNPAHRGAAILVAGANFGCGSSREHAPQAIKRWGIQAVVAESFAEIFYGNSLMIGLACATAPAAEIERLTALADSQPDLEFHLDIEARTLTADDLRIAVTIPDSVRTALLTGDWDATSLLLDKYDEVEAVAARLPYIAGWNR
jgi:3-isopropylmalate/(R)-2-methylmalate dehydratase small subunit